MKILAVDNNPTVLRVLTSFLIDELGHEVRTASDGLSALHIVEEFTPDVVITDLVMPNIGGDKLCRLIRDLPRLNECFIIILSAIAAEESYTECGADACVAKGKAADVKEHLRGLLEQAAEHKSDRLFEVDLTLGLDQVHDREVTRELLDSRNYYAAIVDSLDDGIFGLNYDGVIIHLNPAAGKISGVPEEKALTREFATLFSEREREVVRRGLHQLERKREPFNIDSDPPLHINGNYVQLRCLPIQSDGQRAVVVVMRDQSVRVINTIIAAPNEK